ncbi:MAG: cell division protein FtsB [Pseudomonadota bacterium]|jgi:cell division protein FtsB
MRLITIALAGLLLLIQFPLWLGKGGWLAAWDLDQKVMAANKRNDDLKARNAKLESEVRDLKNGTGALEERARAELGMIKQDEVFIQIVSANDRPANPPANVGTAGTAPNPASPTANAAPNPSPAAARRANNH